MNNAYVYIVKSDKSVRIFVESVLQSVFEGLRDGLEY